MTASPRPWVIGQFSGTGLHYYIDAANDDQVADVYEFDDAALCVRAVNAYDDMLDALEAAELYLPHWEEPRGPHHAGECPACKLQAALALAKGADR